MIARLGTRAVEGVGAWLPDPGSPLGPYTQKAASLAPAPNTPVDRRLLELGRLGARVGTEGQRFSWLMAPWALLGPLSHRAEQVTVESSHTFGPDPFPFCRLLFQAQDTLTHLRAWECAVT